jgi:hypothetical protein
VSISQAEPCGKKFPAKLTPLMKAMIMGLGKMLSATIAEKIGRRMIVTGVPARNADKSEEMLNVINTAMKILSFIIFPKIVAIKSENPNFVKEFERMNNIAKSIIIFHEISFLTSEKSELFI